MAITYGEGWTDERVAMLLKLRDEGHGMTSIARLMSITRSAVIGKLHRMGQSAGRLKNGKGALALSPTKTVNVGRRKRIQHLQRTEPLAAVAPPARLLPSVAPDLPLLSQRGEASQGVPFAGLEPHHCRWPIGDPHEDGFHFCGADKLSGVPYCAQHCAMAYQKPIRTKGVVNYVNRRAKAA